mmetsp:Transcript_31964/g.61164  ORF Transcript_31964/g.61164 Transcript_31964/m.61164 type:complete len:89 (+) Transcript_31964:1768-2034(+)
MHKRLSHNSSSAFHSQIVITLHDDLPPPIHAAMQHRVLFINTASTTESTTTSNAQLPINNSSCCNSRQWRIIVIIDRLHNDTRDQQQH